MPIIASAIARGTVRAVSRTSPLGTSAHSMPANAKINSSDVRATSPAGGHRRDPQVLGVDEERAADGDEQQRQELGDRGDRVEPRAEATPRRLTSDQKAKAATRIAISIQRPASAGTSRPRLDANTVATAAVANVPSIQSSTPEMKPTYGPNAVPT